MNSFADGLNYYLAKHPEVKPRVITRFEPWMALSFTEGSIGSKAPADQLVQSLAAASDRLQADFGNWKTPWGDINRFQRITDDIVQPFSDAGPSIAGGFTSANWGSLASFGARAMAVTAGGESGDPKSPHFNDQAKRYSMGDLREVYFYRSQLQGHTERQYHPGS